jgi:hypothetical protein
VNAAIDENLAIQIWNMIESESYDKKQKKRTTCILCDICASYLPDRTYLMISTSGAFYSNCLALLPILVLSQASQVQIFVKIGREERLLPMKRESILNPDKTYRVPERLQRIIQSLWKLSDSEMDYWTSHWTSFPLDQDSPVVILTEFFSPQIEPQDSLAFQNRLQVHLQVVPRLLTVRVWSIVVASPYKPTLRSQNSRVSACLMM